MSNKSDLDICRDLLSIIDEMYQPDVKLEVPAENVTQIKEEEFSIDNRPDGIEATEDGEIKMYDFTAGQYEINGVGIEALHFKYDRNSPEPKSVIVKHRPLNDELSDYFVNELEDMVGPWTLEGPIDRSEDGTSHEFEIKPKAGESLEEKKMVTFQTSVGMMPGYDDHTPLSAEDYHNWTMKTDKSNPKPNIVSQRYAMYVQDFKEYANESISEAMMDAYGQDEDGVTNGQVTFSQEKGTERGSVKIEAAADDMQELAKVLALAGITLPQAKQEELLMPKDDEEHECGDDCEKDCCAGDDNDDARYSVDKKQILHMIKNKLKQKMMS